MAGLNAVAYLFLPRYFILGYLLVRSRLGRDWLKVSEARAIWFWEVRLSEEILLLT